MNYKKIKRNIFRIFLFCFAGIGVVFTFVYIGMKTGLFNVRGSISERNSYFGIDKNFRNSADIESDLELICKINVLNKYAPLTSMSISKNLINGVDESIIEKMVETASIRFQNENAFIRDMNNCDDIIREQKLNILTSAYNWADTDEWALMKEVFTRDQDVIKSAAKDAGISARLILSCVMGEQFRFFNGRRDSFKSYFEPLKILASLSNTSFGIAGLKPKTVGLIEGYLKDKNSIFYLGPNMEHIVDYKEGTNIESEQMDRITNSKDPYYPYLYVGLYLREISAQWEKSGYDISNNAGVLATLYNLGFYYSVPKENPQIGGAVISINGRDYTFGDIAHEFYYSGELSDIFPLEVQ